ncbi:hypothetical protein G6F42_024291 [Rhizopus arrhizus]|nr:hypothetical protein G6F42_024291 [Rhizopus arrhizus]
MLPLKRLNHDHAAPLELGLVINALQTSLTEQQQQEEEQEEERPVETHVTANQSVSSPRPTSVAVTDVLPAVTFGSKGLKREEAVIVDYELDHGANSTSRESNTTGSANVIVLDCIDPKSVKPNNLTPREQEKADEPVLRAMHHLFSNRFMKAKRLFEQQAQSDPLYALGLGSMAFLKALMSNNQQAAENAISVLVATYNLANAQIDNATRKNVGGTVIHYLASYCNSIKFSRGSGVPTNVAPAKPKALEMHKVNIIPNGVLRAHVVKAEACLQMAILYLSQESMTGYIKCGLNLRRGSVL